MRRLLMHAPLAVEAARWTDPHTKANALLQAHFSRAPVAGDLAADQRTVVLQAVRLLQVCAPSCCCRCCWCGGRAPHLPHAFISSDAVPTSCTPALRTRHAHACADMKVAPLAPLRWQHMCGAAPAHGLTFVRQLPWMVKAAPETEPCDGPNAMLPQSTAEGAWKIPSPGRRGVQAAGPWTAVQKLGWCLGQATVDVISSSGWLHPALAAMELASDHSVAWSVPLQGASVSASLASRWWR